MSNNFYRPDQLSLRYASALVDLAEDKKAIDKVEKDVEGLLSLIGESVELKSFIKNPQISATVKQQTISEIAKKAKFHELTTNLLNVLIQNKRLNILQNVLQTIIYVLQDRRGMKSASVTVANDLTADQKKALEKALNKALDAQVKLDIKTDENIIGGMIVTVGSKMVDDSVRSKIERMRKAMTSGEAGGDNVINA